MVCNEKVVRIEATENRPTQVLPTAFGTGAKAGRVAFSWIAAGATKQLTAKKCIPNEGLRSSVKLTPEGPQAQAQTVKL